MRSRNVSLMVQNAKIMNENLLGKNVKTSENEVVFRLDSGYQVNVNPKSQLLKWHEKAVFRKNNTCVLNNGDNIVPIISDFYLKSETNKHKITYKLLVTTLDSCSILAFEAYKEQGKIQRLSLINKNLVEQFSKNFRLSF